MGSAKNRNLSGTSTFSAETSTKMPLARAGRRKTKVSFGRNTCQLYLKDITQEEKNKVWYNRHDYIRIHSSNHDQVRGALGCHHKGRDPKHALSWPDDETCHVRGLEHHFPGCNNEKRHKRRQHAHYLLHAHKYLQVTSPQELRDYAVSMSSYDQQRAQRIADFDAYEAFRVHQESNLPFLKEYSEFSNVPKPTNLSTITPRQRSITAQLA